MGKKQSGYSGENYLNCLPLSTRWKQCGEFKAEDRGEFVDEPRSKSGMRKRCVPYPVQLERGEYSELLRKVTSQTDGGESVVRGLLLLYTELFDPCFQVGGLYVQQRRRPLLTANA